MILNLQVKSVGIVIGQSNTGGEKNPFFVDLLDTSGSHTCSLKTGKVKCWGLNDKGQLGYGSTDNIGDGPNEIRISRLADVDVHPDEANHLTKFIATGGQHTCVVLENECIKCWGNNENGQLGYSDTSNNRGDAANEMGRILGPVGGLEFKVKTHGEEDAKKYAVLATGGDHTCAITKDDTVRCWGANDKGQLGQNSAESTFIEPDKIPDIDIHNDPDETDQAKIDSFLPQHVATGAKHTCALLDNKCVKCWGENKYGQLGYEVTEDNLNLGDDTDEMGTNLPPVGNLDFKVKAIAIGDSHTCAIMNSDDSVQCWGLNDKGQLGLGSTGDAADNKVTLDATNNLTATQVDLGSHTAKSITAGAKHTCVTLDDDSTKCFGLNDKGQLGLGSTEDIGDLESEMGDNLQAVLIENSRIVAGSAVAGGDNTCFIVDDGKVKCWGDNQHGQLAKEHTCPLGNGYGYSASSNDKCNTPDATDVMGKTVDTIDYLSFE